MHLISLCQLRITNSPNNNHSVLLDVRFLIPAKEPPPRFTDSPIPTACALMKKLIAEDFTIVDEPTSTATTPAIPHETIPYNIRWATHATVPIEPKVASEQVPSGKVKALTKFYDSLRDTNNNCTQSVSDNRPRLSSSTPSLNDHLDKLSPREEQEIVNQLKQWSEFGSMSDGVDAAGGMCNLHKSKSCEDSLHTLSGEDYGRCQYLDEVYEKLDGQQRPIARSETNLNRYHVMDYGWSGQFPPDGFILRKVKLCRKNCTNVENNRIKLSLTYYPSAATAARSCPNLRIESPPSAARFRPFSPRTDRVPTTLRQLKKQHNLIRILKSINRKYSSSQHSTVDGNGNGPAPEES